MDAVVAYHLHTAPQREHAETLTALKTRAASVEEHIAALQQSLAEVSEQLKPAMETTVAAEAHLKEVVNGMGVSTARHSLASAMLSFMDDEDRLWRAVLSSQSESMQCAMARLLVAAASATYLGSASHGVRHNLQREWYAMCAAHGMTTPDHADSLQCNGCEDCWLATSASSPDAAHIEKTMQGTLLSAHDVLTWTHACGLPHHVAAVASATICLTSSRWPLLIDPQVGGGDLRRMYHCSPHWLWHREWA